MSRPVQQAQQVQQPQQMPRPVQQAQVQAQVQTQAQVQPIIPQIKKVRITENDIEYEQEPLASTNSSNEINKPEEINPIATTLTNPSNHLITLYGILIPKSTVYLGLILVIIGVVIWYYSDSKKKTEKEQNKIKNKN